MSRHVIAKSILDVDIETQGKVPARAVAYARSRIGAVAGHTHEPILYARAKLTRSSDPALARPSIAQASLDVDGRVVRARAAGETMLVAIDLLHDRLVRRLDRMAQHWEARRGGRPTPGEHEWRHGEEPSHRAHHYPRPADEREIVRHKSFALVAETPDEAAFEMDVLDYDFHLFTDVDTHLDSVMYRAGPTGYRLARTAPGPVPSAAVSLTVSPQPAPRLKATEAVERLVLTGWPFVFFVDADSGRGSVLYHRHDGSYGLIAPAA